MPREPGPEEQKHLLNLRREFPGCDWQVSPPAGPSRPLTLVTWVDGPTLGTLMDAGLGPRPGDYRRSLSSEALCVVAAGYWVDGRSLAERPLVKDSNIPHQGSDAAELGRLLAATTTNEWIRDNRPYDGSLRVRSIIADLIHELTELGPALVQAAGLDIRLPV